METNQRMFDPEHEESQREPEAAETPVAPPLTRVNRVSGHELADKLRQLRRLQRLSEKGY